MTIDHTILDELEVVREAGSPLRMGRSFSPVLSRGRKYVQSLSPSMFSEDKTILYYPGAGDDTSIIDIVQASISRELFEKVEFFYQDKLYDEKEIDAFVEKCGGLEECPQWSREHMKKFLEKVNGRNITILPTKSQGNDLSSKADIIYLCHLGLFDREFPFNIMSNAREGTYIVGLNYDLDEFSFFFDGIEQLSHTVRRVKDTETISKYGDFCKISPRLCKLLFDYQHNIRRDIVGEKTMFDNARVEAVMKTVRQVLPEGWSHTTNSQTIEQALRKGLKEFHENISKGA